MKKVITYGTYDLLHYGHVRLLERAKALGDYLIVGVTSDDYDKTRGKINVQQSLMERIEAVRATGLADEIIVEEYEGQKIDDIRRYGIDVFTVGSDWTGKFDYLKDYCQVVYLNRTEGVSSSEIRQEKSKVRFGLVGNSSIVAKVAEECAYVNGMELAGIASENPELISQIGAPAYSFDELLPACDALYIYSNPGLHYEQVKRALQSGKHVLCKAPLCLSEAQAKELFALAEEKSCVLMDGIKTAYSTAFSRLVLMAKTGKIGDVYSVDAVCTSLTENNGPDWDSISAWGPIALLPIFQVLGTDVKYQRLASHIGADGRDEFTKISLEYDHAVASVKVGQGVKSEGELVISGTKGYIYVPAPWWKTDYFEIRYENTNENKKYFYQLEGEGIRYELVSFVQAIQHGKALSNVDEAITCKMCKVMEEYYAKINYKEL